MSKGEGKREHRHETRQEIQRRRSWCSKLVCHGQTAVSDRVRGSRGSGISDEITKMDFGEGLFPEGKSVT